MHKAYSRMRTAGVPGSGLAEDLPHPVADGLHLEAEARDLLQHFLGPHPLTLAPELAQQRARVSRREPAVAELLPQVRAELGFEPPGAQVRRDVEARVDVGE